MARVLRSEGAHILELGAGAMLSEDEELSLRSAVKLLRLIVQQSSLPVNKKLEADESLRRLMVALCGTAELPELGTYRPRSAA